MLSTGLKGLDDILTGLRVGDNVVWQIDNISDYRDFVEPFTKQAIEDGRNLIYMRFAQHEALLEPSKKVKMYKLDPDEGFESFATQVNKIITKEGEGAYYVFDCLSDLLPAWATDLMIGNFFMVTCPYLYELDTVTYFAILRDKHSFKTVARIRETTQLLIDVHHSEEHYYLHPLKVWNRYTPTMFLPHVREDGIFVPLTDSVNATQVLGYISKKGHESAKRNLDYWDCLFLEAEEMSRNNVSAEEKDLMVRKLARILLSRDNKIMEMVYNRFTLEDLIDIKARLIGTGLIGGKAIGMLLARKILLEDKDLEWRKISEPHDSFYIGSDLFYTYIVQNGWWKLRMRQKTKEEYFDAAVLLKAQMLQGKFPVDVREQFQQMIEYFGTSPFIVRSSSLLEDGFGNAFAGKYESFFCSNQGTPEQRYMEFAEAVRKIYASTMSEDALAYRKQRGLDMLDEQMALLVQRVSGAYHENYFFPDVAGVGISHNTYVWNSNMDPSAGMLRLVFGLGTRAVDRVEGDYPRIAALDAPLRKPQAEMKDIKRFSQHDVDLIDIGENRLRTVPFTEILSKKLDLNIDSLAIRDTETERYLREKGVTNEEHWILTFDNLLSKGPFTDIMRRVMKTLEAHYNYPVDIEFTLNFTGGDVFKINLLQCRPLQTRGIGRQVDIPTGIKKENTLFQSEGHFLGGNVSHAVHRVIMVAPDKYAELSLSDKYDIARTVGKLNRQIEDREQMETLLLGPGRWGTTTPALGIPVSFSEINNISILGEIASTGRNLMPELSFGTHFFQDLVETNIFYVGLFPDEEKVVFNPAWLLGYKNIYADLLPDVGKFDGIIDVYDIRETGLRIMSDIQSQKVVCFCQQS